MEIEDVSQEVDRVSRVVYRREQRRMILECLSLLSTFQEELEEGSFPPADDHDEVDRERLLAVLRHAELELEHLLTHGEPSG